MVLKDRKEYRRRVKDWSSLYSNFPGGGRCIADRFCLQKGFVQLMFCSADRFCLPIGSVQLIGFVQPISYRFFPPIGYVRR
jgi:hypothetical protein